MSNTWFLDFDGTLVYHKSYKCDTDFILPSTITFFRDVVKENDVVIITTARTKEKYKDRIENFMKKYGLKYHHIIYGITRGVRIVINDIDSNGTNRALAFNVTRDSDDLKNINICNGN